MAALCANGGRLMRDRHLRTQDGTTDPIERESVARALPWTGRDGCRPATGRPVEGKGARANTVSAAEYLIRTPLVTNLLEQGISTFGHSCEEFEINQL